MTKETERLTLASLNRRVEALENIAGDLTKIKNLIKVYAPIFVAAAITSDTISAKLGQFLTALLGM